MEILKDCANSMKESKGEQANLKKTLIDDGKFIPKHRFDCINLSLKEHKELVRELESSQAVFLKQNKVYKEIIKELTVYKTENELLKKLYLLTLSNVEEKKHDIS